MSNTFEEIKPNRRWTWDQWMKGRYQRRMSGNEVAPAVIRRPESKDDEHLRKRFDGQRGPDFVSDKALREIAIMQMGAGQVAASEVLLVDLTETAPTSAL